MGDNTIKGSCFCGDVKLTLTGESIEMGYCHCNSCRHWSASPVNAFTLWPTQSLTIIKGEDNIGTYNKTPGSSRKWCQSCGGHVFTDHPSHGIVDVYAAIIPDYPFKPKEHVFYEETVLRIKDGLPKLKDMAEQDGGCGVLLSE